MTSKVGGHSVKMTITMYRFTLISLEGGRALSAPSPVVLRSSSMARFFRPYVQPSDLTEENNAYSLETNKDNFTKFHMQVYW